MTKEQERGLSYIPKPFKYWMPIVLFALTIATVIWSGSARFQQVDSKGSEIENRVDRLDSRYDKRLTRIEDKIDLLIQHIKKE